MSIALGGKAMLVGQSLLMKELRARLARIADTNFTVLVEGESDPQE